MQKLRMALMAGATLVAAATVSGAQMRGPANIPAGFQPPAGMCRVWYNGVAPGRQPAPTNCATARARVTSNSFLVYGQGTSPQQGNGRWGNIPNTNGSAQGPWNDGRNDRRDDRMTEKQRREWEKAHRKAQKEREKEWKKAHKHGDRDGDDRDDDDDRRDNRDRNGTVNRTGTTSGQGGWGTRIPTTQGRRIP